MELRTNNVRLSTRTRHVLPPARTIREVGAANRAELAVLEPAVNAPRAIMPGELK
jgi:hypothetical protein